MVGKPQYANGGMKQTQIHRQENEAPTIIDTIATGYLRAGPSKSVTLPS
jgi:hypothetical protein